MGGGGGHNLMLSISISLQDHFGLKISSKSGGLNQTLTSKAHSLLSFWKMRKARDGETATRGEKKNALLSYFPRVAVSRLLHFADVRPKSSQAPAT